MAASFVLAKKVSACIIEKQLRSNATSSAFSVNATLLQSELGGFEEWEGEPTDILYSACSCRVQPLLPLETHWSK